MSRADGGNVRWSRIVLTADDFALSPGVSAGIAELAGEGRLSATSALVTLPDWPEQARPLVHLRKRLAVGLHLNLTLGRPLTPMPHLCPDGRLPAIGSLTRLALAGRVEPGEIERETYAQLERFAAEVGSPPDFLDGHQHAHALPRVRDGVLAATRRFLGRRPGWLRDPADSLANILRRGVAVGKALAVAALARGFGAQAKAAGLTVNDSFAGFSSFDVRVPYERELARFLTSPGQMHIVMCHPGRPDALLAERDPVTLRRRDELLAIAAYPGLPELIWRPERASDDD